MKTQMNIAVPAGIGDVSWILSKLVNVSDRYDFNIEVADGAPYRTVPFLRMFPWISKADYGNFHYTDLHFGYHSQNLYTWKAIEESGRGRIWLTNNPHLEAGNRLEDWLPDLPTDFHYPINEGKLAAVRTNHILESCRKKFHFVHPLKLYGISAASYRGAQAWNTWEYEDWATFLTLWSDHDRGARFILMGGGWDDLTRSLYEEFADLCFDAVGKTSFATAINLHRNLDGYVGFSSGLGIIRTVINKKTFMFWPEFQEKLSTSWAPPDMLEAGTYDCCLWQEPESAFKKVEAWLKR